MKNILICIGPRTLCITKAPGFGLGCPVLKSIQHAGITPYFLVWDFLGAQVHRYFDRYIINAVKYPVSSLFYKLHFIDCMVHIINVLQKYKQSIPEHFHFMKFKVSVCYNEEMRHPSLLKEQLHSIELIYSPNLLKFNL